MATEYKLSYAASEIDERLGMIDNMVKSVNGKTPDANGNIDIEIPESGGNVDQVILKSPDGTEWNITVSNSGVITATKVSSGDSGETEEGTVLESYVIFVPQNVSDEWNTGGYNDTAQAKTLAVSTSEFLEMFYDCFVSAPPSGMTVTKQSIGKDESGMYDMWEYDFCPTNYNRTILLSSGMHTYELAASFGLANFISHLYTDTGNNAFDYIRNNVRIKVIPVVNPWGFNQSPKRYGNVNGVNLNRNFDIDRQWANFPFYTPSENEWNVKGGAPFSEAEVTNLAKWALDNWNAEFWIDCHTGLGYNDKALWVYYSSDSVILDKINGGISAIEAWFKETYGGECVTTRTIDNEGSIRMRWTEICAGIPGMTLEQAPGRTSFGTATNNDSGDISNYSTNISTFVQEFLLDKYRNTEEVEIKSISIEDVDIYNSMASKTVTAVISPANTTQNKFEWTSSNEDVVKVYGGTNKAVILPVSIGNATITITNRYNPAITDSFVVTVSEPVANENTFTIGGLSFSSNGEEISNTARLRSDFISIEPCKLTIESNNGYYVKAFGYEADGTYTGADGICGNLETTSATTELVPSNVATMRIIMKKPSGGDFTEEEAKAASVTITVEPYLTFSIGSINWETGEEISNTARLRTDFVSVNSGEVVALNELNNISIKPYFYDANKQLIDNTFAFGTQHLFFVPDNCEWIRVVAKKSDGTDFTEEEAANAYVEMGSNVVKDYGALAVEYGTIGSVANELTESNIRARTAFISVEDSNLLVYYNGDGAFEYAVKSYDNNSGNVLFTIDWKKANTCSYLQVGCNSKVMLLFRYVDAPDSELTALPTGTVYVNGVLYELTSQ